MSRQQESFSFNLEDYLRRIRDVKAILNNGEFREFANRVNELINDHTDLSSQVDKLLKEREQAHREARAREIELKLTINSLTRNNEVLNAQVREQDIQIAKLQELINQDLSCPPH
jgi:carbonic anhydrase